MNESKLQTRWATYPEVEWDGVTPLLPKEDDEAEIISTPAELQDYLVENSCLLSSLRLCLCRRCTPDRQFRLEDWWENRVAVDDEPQMPVLGPIGKFLEELVNGWLADNWPCWETIEQRPTLESLKRRLAEK